jgi:hypothetical protein
MMERKTAAAAGLHMQSHHSVIANEKAKHISSHKFNLTGILKLDMMHVNMWE